VLLPVPSPASVCIVSDDRSSHAKGAVSALVTAELHGKQQRARRSTSSWLTTLGIAERIAE
jgi:hypothetical protein